MKSLSLISLRYLVLRAITAGSALAAGLIQTFVFARVVSPELFSQYILVATLGISLWMFDFGIAKVLFVQLRNWFLSGREGDEPGRNATAVVAFYLSLVVVGSVLCCAGMALHSTVSLQQAVEFGLFFLFTALTLVWFTIRNISVAVDAFIRFETLDAVRRVTHTLVILSLLAGVPMLAALLIGNLIWAVVMGLTVKGLIERRALLPRLRGHASQFIRFFRSRRAEILRTGTYAINEHFLYNFPYFFVVYAFGLGVPTIILDTAFKVFRGANVVYCAACDVTIPRQTRAYKERDQAALIHATLIGAALCAVPALGVSALLIFGAERLFSILLGNAATVPPAVTPILVTLMLANLVQTVSNFLLVHTGYFREIARLATAMTCAMIAMSATALVARVDMIGFLELYTAVYVIGAMLYGLLAIRGPIRDARDPAAAAPNLIATAAGLPPK